MHFIPLSRSGRNRSDPSRDSEVGVHDSLWVCGLAGSACGRCVSRPGPGPLAHRSACHTRRPVGAGHQEIRAGTGRQPDHRARWRSRLPGADAVARLAYGLLALALHGGARAGDHCRGRADRPGRGGRRCVNRPRARPGSRGGVRQLSGRGGVPSQRRRAWPPAGGADGGHVSHQPVALRRRPLGERGAGTRWYRRICRSTRCRRTASAS